MVIEGPNCLGCTNYVARVPLTFVETNMQTPPKGARAVGIASQSGALAAVLATALHPRGLYVSTSVSTGNEAASGVEDYVEWLVDDEDTHVITMYVESLRRPRRRSSLPRAVPALPASRSSCCTRARAPRRRKAPPRTPGPWRATTR
jgi:acyl-CoA synthetase (NDP forming)